jgi:hypothetical protein
MIVFEKASNLFLFFKKQKKLKKLKNYMHFQKQYSPLGDEQIAK